MSTNVISERIVTPVTIKTIYERRAIRKYKDKPVEKQIIEQIIDAGRMAPSAMNRQPWKFYVLTDKENIRIFSKEIRKVAARDFLKAGLKQIIKMGSKLFHSSLDFLKTEDPVFYQAPVVIFITAPRDNEWAALDVGMCAQNIMLAAKSMGLDSCPVGFAKYVEHTKSFPRLKVPVSEHVHLSVVLGYGDEKPAAHKRNKDNVVFVD